MNPRVTLSPLAACRSMLSRCRWRSGRTGKSCMSGSIMTLARTKANLTGPELLYQVECHLRTVLGHDRFRSGGSQPQGPMGTNLIVVSSPTFHEHLYLPECSKQFSIQQFIA